MAQHKKKSDVAVIIVNYNGAHLTCKCIDTINNSTYKADIIVVDNASGAGDVETIKKQHPEAVVLSNSYNAGFSGANNRAIEYAVERGYNYLMLLNNDTEIDPLMIEILKDSAREDTVVVPCMYYFDSPQKLWYAGGYIDKRTGTAKHIENIDTGRQADGTFCDFATGCCIMLCRETIEKVGLLDEAFFMYQEDVDYSIRLREQGIRILLQPAAKLWHKVGSTSGGKKSPMAIYYGSRNKLINIKKHRDYFLWTAYPYTIVSRVVRCISGCLRRETTWRLHVKAVADYEKGITGEVKLK